MRSSRCLCGDVPLEELGLKSDVAVKAAEKGRSERTSAAADRYGWKGGGRSSAGMRVPPEREGGCTGSAGGKYIPLEWPC